MNSTDTGTINGEKMKYVEAPQNLERSPGEVVVFLAGGITGCPDWQQELTEMLKDTNLTILNPRRKDFPINDPSAAREQIFWEFEHLGSADIISFWFCKETIQPIVLFELGAWSRQSRTDIVIGVHPDYQRKQDVYIQMSLLGYDEIETSLDDLAQEIKYLGMR